MLSFKFTPSSTDYTKAFWTFYLSNWVGWALMIFIAIFLGACGLTLIFSNVSVPSYLAMLSFAVALSLIFYLSFSLLINPYRAGRRAQQDERLISPVEYQVNDEQLVFKNGFVETKLDWGSVHRVIESPDFFLLTFSTNKNMFQFIPKRAFTSGDDEKTFQSIIKAKISGSYSKGITPNVSPKAVVLLGIIISIGIFLCGIVTLFMWQITNL